VQERKRGEGGGSAGRGGGERESAR